MPYSSYKTLIQKILPAKSFSYSDQYIHTGCLNVFMEDSVSATILSVAYAINKMLSTCEEVC